MMGAIYQWYFAPMPLARPTEVCSLDYLVRMGEFGIAKDFEKNFGIYCKELRLVLGWGVTL